MYTVMFMPCIISKKMLRLIRSLLALGVCFSLCAYDEILQYRPPIFFGEPHIARDGLMAGACNLTHGSTYHSYNGCGKRVPLCRIWEPTCSNNAITVPSAAWVGKFSLTEIIVTAYQEFMHGIFVSAYVPVRFLHIRHAREVASSSSQEYTSSSKGMGDLAWSLGWAYNYEDFETIDFIDITLQAGVALPTSRPLCPQSTFNVPLGYQGHTGFFGILDGSWGIFDWLTFGGHLQLIGFSSAYECIPRSCVPLLGSSKQSSALCDLPKRWVERHPATVVGLYTKADHLILGLSLMVGYSYMHQADRSVQGEGQRLLPSSCSSYFDSWSMHTVHTSLDYDWATYTNVYAPRVSIMYNTVVGGKRIVPLPLFQGSIDFSILFSF